MPELPQRERLRKTSDWASDCPVRDCLVDCVDRFELREKGSEIGRVLRKGTLRPTVQSVGMNGLTRSHGANESGPLVQQMTGMVVWGSDQRGRQITQWRAASLVVRRGGTV